MGCCVTLALEVIEVGQGLGIMLATLHHEYWSKIMALFCYLCPINSSLDLHGPVSNVPHSLIHRPAQFSGCTKNPIFGAHSSCNQRLCGPGNVQFFASRNRRVPFLLSFDQSNRSITETIDKHCFLPG